MTRIYLQTCELQESDLKMTDTSGFVIQKHDDGNLHLIFSLRSAVFRSGMGGRYENTASGNDGMDGHSSGLPGNLMVADYVSGWMKRMWIIWVNALLDMLILLTPGMAIQEIAEEDDSSVAGDCIWLISCI